jgi:hypothetical protein
MWVKRCETWDADVLGRERVNAARFASWFNPGISLGRELGSVNGLEGVVKCLSGDTIVMISTLGAIGVALFCTPKAERVFWPGNQKAMQTSALQRMLRSLLKFILMVTRSG